jgi:hypothetical protein
MPTEGVSRQTWTLFFGWNGLKDLHREAQAIDDDVAKHGKTVHDHERCELQEEVAPNQGVQKGYEGRV